MAGLSDVPLKARTAIFATLTVFCGAVIAVTAKLTTARVPPFEQIFIRSLLCLAASPLLGGSGLPALSRSPNWMWLVARGVLGFLASMCYMEAAQRMPLITVAIVTRMHPLMGPAIVRLLSGERVLAQQGVGYLVGIVGVSVATPEDTWRATSPYSFGFNYIMAATVTTALSFHCIYKLTKLQEDKAAVRDAFHVAGLVGGVFFGVLRRKVLAQPTLLELAYIAAGAVATIGLQWGLSHLFEAGKRVNVVPFLLLAPVFSGCFGMLLGEGTLRQEESLGVSLIALALAIGYLGIFGYNGYSEDEDDGKKKS